MGDNTLNGLLSQFQEIAINPTLKQMLQTDIESVPGSDNFTFDIDKASFYIETGKFTEWDNASDADKANIFDWFRRNKAVGLLMVPAKRTSDNADVVGTLELNTKDMKATYRLYPDDANQNILDKHVLDYQKDDATNTILMVAIVLVIGAILLKPGVLKKF